ncbi:hypothetical protein GCM10011399_34200 [Subtercola lobariae]|uniref:Uncharacterized protein n=1 Tax=Subtercola lobariae TaxID=1588641 RepID=A0A917BE24_9MICO|nr:hypothetical protein GCM10011399_34200 [Subtercola lobariae]
MVGENTPAVFGGVRQQRRRGDGQRLAYTVRGEGGEEGIHRVFVFGYAAPGHTTILPHSAVKVARAAGDWLCILSPGGASTRPGTRRLRS